MNQHIPEHIEFTDHLDRVVRIPQTPQRIISLCPSQTELLVDLGLQERLVGRTRFCIHPSPEIKKTPMVGGTKEVNLDRIRSLSPDLIICEKEENTSEMVEMLAREFPVYVTDVLDLGSALQMIRDIGEICNEKQQAYEMSIKIESLFDQFQPIQSHQTAAYLIWKEPWMVVSDTTYIDCMLTKCGFENVFTNLTGRYPSIELQELISVAPELIFLSSEPYPFKTKHIEELAASLPNSKIMLVDGEMFTWYGSRMLEAVEYLQNLTKSVV